MSETKHPTTASHAPVHATREHHHAVALESVHFLDGHAESATGAPPSAEQALAFCRYFGFTAQDVAAALSAEGTPEQARAAHNHNLVAIGRAFTPAVVTALTGPHSPVTVTAATAAQITTAAATVRSEAAVCAKLRAAAAIINDAGRVASEPLDAVTSQVMPQIEAIGAADPTKVAALAPIAAYFHARYPGGGHAAAPAAPPAGSHAGS